MPPRPPSPILAPPQRDTALRLLQNPVCSMEDVAEALQWTLDQLTLFLTSEEGLVLIAECELACAVRARVAAAAQLHAAIDALGMMLTEYASTSRNTPLDESKLDTHTLREKQRTSARRAAHLLFRISHYTPRPIRALTPTSPMGEVPRSSAAEGATCSSLPSSPQPPTALITTTSTRGTDIPPVTSVANPRPTAPSCPTTTLNAPPLPPPSHPPRPSALPSAPSAITLPVFFRTKPTIHTPLPIPDA